jgi:beta-glucosidase
METLLRSAWGFAGHFVSDCGAVSDIARGHNLARDAAEAAALALRRGCDLECGETYGQLGEALARGMVAEADLDRALSRVLTTRFRLGMFDPPEQVPFAATPLSVVGCDEHRALAREAAAKSIVLLKNHNGLLPLQPDLRNLRVLGPMAANADVLLGNYAGLSDSLTTILEGLVARLPEGMGLDYRPGTDAVYANLSEQDWLFSPRDQPSVTIVCLGLSPLMEGEESDTLASTENGDRASLELPAVQAAFLRRLAATGVRIVLVLTGGGPIALGDLADLAEAIVFVWYPGQEGGHAVADVLFGHVAPSGKLPVTFPAATADLPPFDNYSMAGRTYRYLAAEPLYPFGFGLSYTRFAYRTLNLSASHPAPGQSITVSVEVANVGAVEAEEVAQCYLSDLAASVPVPHAKLIGFQRLRLAPSATQTITFTLTPAMLALVDDAGGTVTEPGDFRVTVGGCSPGARGLALGAPKSVSTVFTLTSGC